ncbi:MAG: DUF6140 family protein [Bacteroidales bacterium]|nr:DUF6140 family protein [Bacteroidales bacterium]
MPIYRITTKCRTNTNGVFVEPGLSVQVVTKSLSNPVLSDGGKLVAEAFLRVYGLDLKKAGALNSMYLNCEKIE